jgi:hypothetical protein
MIPPPETRHYDAWDFAKVLTIAVGVVVLLTAIPARTPPDVLAAVEASCAFALVAINELETLL